MTVLTISVDDEQAELVKKLLKDVSSIKIIEEAVNSVKENNQQESNPSKLKKIQAILKKAKSKNLFKEIEDPSEWQRQIRKEWERDF